MVKNWALFLWNCEAAAIMCLGMAIAVFADGWTSLAGLGVFTLCLLWFALFFHINKEILARWISEGIKEAGRKLYALTHPKKKSSRELVIITFPGSRES